MSPSRLDETRVLFVQSLHNGTNSLHLLTQTNLHNIYGVCVTGMSRDLIHMCFGTDKESTISFTCEHIPGPFSPMYRHNKKNIHMVIVLHVY